MASVSLEMKGLEALRQKVDGGMTRRILKVTMREAGKAAKAAMQRRTRPISRRLTRRVKVQIDRAPVPSWAKAINTYAGAAAIDSGRQAGAKAPPAGRLRGGYAAAQLVARRGIRARPFMEPARDDVRGEVNRLLDNAAREMERVWRS